MLRLGDGHIGLQPRDHVEPVVHGVRENARVAQLRRVGDGHPHLRRALLPIESGRHDADNRERVFIEFDSFADSLHVAAEAPLPERIAENRDRLRAALAVFVFGEGASGNGIDAEQRKVTGRNHLGLQTLRLIRAGQIEGALAACRNCREALAVVAQDLESRIRPDRRRCVFF